MAKRTWKIEVILKVDDSWVADGFDASERIDQIEELMGDLLPSAYGHEYSAKARVVSAPDQKIVRRLQGYAD